MITLMQRLRSRLIGFGRRGRDVRVARGCTIHGAARIRLGSSVLVGRGCWLSAVDSEITIGDKVMLAPHVALIAGDHNVRELGVHMHDVSRKRPGDDSPITIESDVWVGYGAIILKGVTVSRGSVIGAGSVVTHDVPPYSIVAGNPAKTIGQRFSAEDIANHERRLQQLAQGSTPDLK